MLINNLGNINFYYTYLYDNYYISSYLKNLFLKNLDNDFDIAVKYSLSLSDKKKVLFFFFLYCSLVQESGPKNDSGKKLTVQFKG